MFDVKRILKVPPQREIRNRLREGARMLMSRENITAPSNLTTLERHAENLLSELNIDIQYVDFAIVLLGNETWREVVAATPFHRRLLLIPQCIRNRDKCKAEIDELGLLCAGCKSCRIDEILTKAEDLGYSTLVAEGTTVTIGLVEEGSIDAVIGVSCMPVLQKSFEPVTRAAIPAIGIPLLSDGCVNSDMDYSWLFEEMVQLKEDKKLQPLSVSLLKNEVDSVFLPENLQKIFSLQNATENLAREMMGMGGQHIRPLLAVLAYRSYATNPQEEIQESLAGIIEGFHKASLIHDDIEDDEQFRYGHATLHRTEGIPMAVNTGDYLIGKGYQMLSAMPLHAETLAACLKVVSSSHTKLAEGQGDDLLLFKNISKHTVGEVVRIFRLKTGEAVKVALMLGAICGGARSAELEYLSSFSDWFGVAYQVRDDLNEFHEGNSDEHAFDFPFLLTLLNRELKKIGQKLDSVLQKKDMEILRAYFNDFSIEEKARNYLEDYKAKCFAELDNLQNSKLRLSLYGVMGKVFKD